MATDPSVKRTEARSGVSWCRRNNEARGGGSRIDQVAANRYNTHPRQFHFRDKSQVMLHPWQDNNQSVQMILGRVLEMTIQAA